MKTHFLQFASAYFELRIAQELAKATKEMTDVEQAEMLEVVMDEVMMAYLDACTEFDQHDLHSGVGGLLKSLHTEEPPA